MKTIISTLIIALFLLQQTAVFAQEPDPTDMGKAFFQDAFKRAYNIEAGVGLQSFLIMEGKASFGDKLKMMPNTYEYYIGFPTTTKLETSGAYMNLNFKIGKRFYSATPEIADSVSITNCSSIEYYFLGASMQFPIKYPLGEYVYWSWKPGLYLDYIMGSLVDEITNGSMSKDMVIISYSDSPQDIKPLDFGAAVNLEFGFRAAYIGLGYRLGLRNLAPNESDMTIRNNGLLNVHLGYRFASQIAKEDQERINRLIPGQ